MILTRRARERHGRSPGYTMMELLVVVALLGVILLVSIPQIARWGIKMQIDGAVRTTAMHIAAARLKAVATGFDHQITVCPSGPAGAYTNLRGDGGVSQFADSKIALVLEGDELDGAGNPTDLNGNNIIGERSNPFKISIAPDAVDYNLVQLLPWGVSAVATPPAALLGGYSGYPPPTLVFRKNGMADMDVTQAALWVLYLTNGTDYYAVSVWHSGRIKTHYYDPVGARWLEE